MWDRVRNGDATTVVGARGIPLGEISARLDAGGGLADEARALGLDAADLIAALGAIALEGDGPALAQESPRRPHYLAVLAESVWAELLPGAARPARLALAAGLLQIFDFWDASHAAAQEADDLGEGWVSAYWHGVAHRREPDPGNASYWFRKVGPHPVCGPIAVQARGLVDDEGLAAKLFAGGVWQPEAFNDFCTKARREDDGLAKALQKVEMMALLEASLPR